MPAVSPNLSFDASAEVRNSRAQRFRNSQDTEDAGIANPTFEAADVAWIEISFFSQLLLREFVMLTFVSQIYAERRKCAMSVCHDSQLGL